ncbi:uroporphyrinogen-III synthase [Arenimonas oryziterrae]|nr:uroporphyrinogen-III synthase [Arenimonas oryziterrae]
MPRARSETSLKQWHVISLRPKDRHAAVRRAAKRLGARVFAISTSILQPTDARTALTAARRADIVIFTSPAAVAFTVAKVSLRSRRGQTWLAIGEGTAAALRRAGIADALAPAQGAHSEALLAHPLLQAVRGTRIGVITAPGGRDLIAQTLQARGADVVRADVYRREPTPPNRARRTGLQRLPATSALLLSSGEALEVLWSALTIGEQLELTARPCVVASERLADLARAKGWSAPILAASARPDDLLTALSAYVRSGRFR